MKTKTWSNGEMTYRISARYAMCILCKAAENTGTVNKSIF